MTERGRPATAVELVALAITLIAIVVFLYTMTNHIHPHH